MKNKGIEVKQERKTQVLFGINESQLKVLDSFREVLLPGVTRSRFIRMLIEQYLTKNRELYGKVKAGDVHVIKTRSKGDEDKITYIDREDYERIYRINPDD